MAFLKCIPQDPLSKNSLTDMRNKGTLSCSFSVFYVVIVPILRQLMRGHSVWFQTFFVVCAVSVYDVQATSFMNESQMGL